MRTHRFLSAACLFVALAAGARAETPGIEEALAVERRIRETADKVVPAFVFIGGGSGVLISSDGWFLTNHHVVADMATNTVFETEWEVRLPGGKFYTADIVGLDDEGDICLGRIRDAKDLPFVEMGDSDELKTGEAVLVVGNPFLLGAMDFRPTVTFGLVSAIHRYMGGYSDSIQTDASVNPGNSGGPLFTIDGKLVGINGRIQGRFGNRVNTGIGFAIPTNQIRNFLRPLKKGGYVPHAILKDIEFKPETTEVTKVVKDKTMAAAGVQVGDVITGVEQYPTRSLIRLLGVLGTYPGGTTVTFHVKRGDEVLAIPVTLDKKRANKLPVADLGASYEDAEGGKGVELLKVLKKSPAGQAGLKEGDFILKVAEKPVATAAELKTLIKSLKPKQKVTVTVKRGEKELEMEVTLGFKK